MIGDQIAVADSSYTRFLGLMGRRSLEPGHGMLIQPSSGVHTFWMRIPIDLVALDAKQRILKLERAVKPWRIGALSRQTKSVLELPSGQIDRCHLAVGDSLFIQSA